MTRMDRMADEQVKVAEAMEMHGGGFVSRLGAALAHADSDNAERIKKAFPEYWKQYKDLGV